jgi:hypothetical protein
MQIVGDTDAILIKWPRIVSMYLNNVNAWGYNSLNRTDEPGAMPNLCSTTGGPKHLDLDNVRNQETFLYNLKI